MPPIRILLIDSSAIFKTVIESSSVMADSPVFEVTVLEPRRDSQAAGAVGADIGAIVFGEKVSSSTVVQYSRTFRTRGVQCPILVLTRQSEAGVPRNYQRAGVDDVLNASDMQTPLFSWMFTSTLRQAEMRKKAKEFDALQSRLASANHSLAFITHEINNPLSVIRLALYHLEAPDLTRARREVLLRMVADNIEKVHTQLDQLRGLRRLLADGSPVHAQAASGHTEKQKVA
jgi:signal transduction histidine kinase